VIRYNYRTDNPWFGNGFVQHSDGEWVKHKDVESMGIAFSDCIAENARLKAEVERLRINEQNQTERIISLEDCIQVLKQDRDGLLYEETEQVASLKAEVERLTKAGDELHAFLINYIVEGRISSAYLNKLDNGWNAAKEGKPNA